MSATKIIILSLLSFTLLIKAAEEFIVLQPLKTDNPPKLLVIIPKSHVPGNQYVDLGIAIQKQSSFSLWIGIPEFPGNLPNPIQIKNRIKQITTWVNSTSTQKIKIGDVFISGHAIGSVVNGLNLQRGDYAGLILLGSNIDNSTNTTLTDLQIPALILAGELDIINRLTVMCDFYKKFLTLLTEHPADSDSIVATKSVIVVPGVIHGYFANGTLKGDLIPDISVETAHQYIATYVSAFLDVNILNPSSTPYKLSLAQLRKSIADSDDILEGFISELNEEIKGSWCSSSQFIIGVLLTEDEFKVTNIPQLSNGLSFDFARPNFIHYGNKMNITIPFRNKYSKSQVSTSEMACKTKSQEAIIKELNSTSARGPAGFCSTINDIAIYYAKNKVSKSALMRYQARGAILKTVNDTQKSNGVTWLAASITYKEEKSEPNGIGANRVISVSSPSLATKLKEFLEPKGVYYCKLLPPSSIIEWILLDSLVVN